MDNSLAEVPPSYGLILQIAGFGFLLLLSMLFSAAETALIGINSSELNELKDQKNKNLLKITEIVTLRSEFLLMTLLLANNLTNISIATIAAVMTMNVFAGSGLENYAMLFEVLVIGVVILLLGEIIPKSYSIRNKKAFIMRFYPPILLFYYLLYPLTFIISSVVSGFVGKFRHTEGSTEYTRKDIENLMEVGGEDGVLEEDEKNMINSIFEFGDKTAKEIMIPRVDMISIPEDISSNELFEFINKNNFSRIPVYKDNIDNITGILYIKDLLRQSKSSGEEFSIAKIVREVTFIPESKEISDLLKMFQREKTHIAIVVDEYGGTAGLITLEDIIEEIVGEIQDEFDDEERLFRKTGEHTYEFDAKIPLDDLREILDIDLPENEDYESLGGYLYDIFGEVPEKESRKTLDGYTFTILSVHKQRIGWVKIEKVQDKNEQNGKNQEKE
jgi:putative hemolysin